MPLLRFIARHTALYFLVALVVSMLLSWGLLSWVEKRAYQQGQLELHSKTDKVAFDLLESTAQSKIIGAVQILGLSEPSFKQVALADLQQDNSLADSRLRLLVNR
ncbi:MAG: hypothetical protein KZQ58_01360 [gamma proteobacterium symbiont of Bathyaustriella thionipta]|nr:hypothetical protein [gamma proteobacterium symbiont of Bathyaustriella thionipta]